MGRDKSGTMSTREVKVALNYLGYCPTEEDLGAVVQDLDADGSGEFSEAEFRRFVRRYREKEHKKLLALFQKFDVDGSGEMDTSELFNLLHRGLGYSPTDDQMAEQVAEVDVDESGELDFQELLKLIETYRMTEGFTREEMKEYDKIFIGFDHNMSGAICTIELRLALRSMGYLCTMDTLQRLFQRVDVDESGELD